MEKVVQLYKVLKRDGYYTKSLEEFQKQFQDPSYQDKVFSVVSRDRLFTKSKEDFLDMYVVKKKDDTESVSGDGSLVLPATTENKDFNTELPDAPVTEETFTVDGQEVTRDEYIAYEDKNLKVPGINLNPFDDRGNQYDGATRPVEVSYEAREGRNTETLQIPVGASAFEQRLATINAYQIDQEEGETVDRFNYLFKDLGFSAEQGGGGILMGLDSFTITAPNNEKKAFNLDPVMGDIFGGETNVAKEIREWMRNNQTDASREKNILISNDEQYRVYYSMQEVQRSVNELQKEERSFLEDQQKLNTLQTNWRQQQAVFDQASNEQFQDPVFKQQYDDHLKAGAGIDNFKSDLIERLEKFGAYSDVIKQQAGKYVTMKQEMGKGDMMWYPKQSWNALTNTLGAVLSTAYGTGQDVLGEGVELFGVGWIPGLNDIYNFFGNDEAIGQSELDFKRDYLNVLEANHPRIYANVVSKLGDDPSQMTVSELREFSAELGGFVERMTMAGADGISGEFTDKVLGGQKYLGIGFDEKIAELARDQHLKRVKDLVKGGDANRKLAQREFDDQGNLIGEIGDLAGYEDKSWSGLRNIFTDYIGFSDVGEEADMEARNDSFIWKSVLGGIESLPAMVTFGRKSVMKSPPKTANRFKKLAFNTQQYLRSRQGTQRSLQMSGFIVDGLNKEINNNPEFAYVSEQQKQAIKLPIALTSSVLEVAGFRNLETGTNFTGAALKIALGKTTRRTTAKEFSDIVTDVVTNPVQKVALRGLAAAGSEFETGLLQEFTETELKRLYNLVNKEQFNTPEFWTTEYAKKLLEAGLSEAIGGAAIGSVAGVYEAATSDKLQQVSDDMFNLYESMIDDDNFRTIYSSKLKQDVIEGKRTQKEADVLMYQFDKLSGIKGQIPADMSIENKKKAIALLLRKGEIETQIDGKDESLTRKKRDEISAIDEKLADLAAVTSQEQADAQKGQEGIKIEATDEQAIKELKQEGVENPSPQQIKKKKDAIRKRETKKVDAQKPTESGSQVGEDVSEQESTPESDQETETENREKTEEEIKLEREEKEDADLEQVIGENVKPDEEVPENLFRNTDGTPENENQNRKEKNTLYNRAKRGAKFLRKLFPDVKIVLYDNEKTFNKLRGIKKGFTESGFYDPKTKTIGINISAAARLGKTGVVAHEIAHAVLIDTLTKAGAGSATATKVTRRLIDAVYKSGNLSAKDKAKIEAFVKGGKYKENIRDEERFAEIISIIANNFNSFSPANKSKVRRLLDKLIDALPNKVKEALDRLGFNVLTASDKEIISFLQVLGSKIGSGTEATASDLEVLDKIIEEETEREITDQNAIDALNEQGTMTPSDDVIAMKKEQLKKEQKKKSRTGPTSGNWSRRSNKLYNAYLAKWEAQQLRKEKAKQKQQNKSLARRRVELGEKYGVNPKGYINNLNFNLSQLEKEAAEVGLRPVPTFDEVTGELVGYYFRTLGGSFVNPMKVESDFNRRSNRIEDGSQGASLIKAGNNILEIVKVAIDNGFTNDTIRRYLKRRNYSTQEINSALDIESKGIFQSLPKSFMNLPGGIKSGLSLMMKLTSKYVELTETNRKNKAYNDKLEKRAAKGNAPSTWYLKLRETKDQDEMMNEVVEYMRTLPEFTAATQSTQLATERDVMLALNPTPNNYAASEIRKITSLMKSRRLAQLEIRSVQRFLRNFMRTVLPRDMYGKGEVISLIDKINALKSPEEVPAVVEEILKKVTIKANKSYMTSIFNILNRKSAKIESGRYKGTRISDDVRQRIKGISKMILNPEAGVEAIKKRINELQARREELESKNDNITDEEINELDDIAVAMIVNNAFMSENDNSNKTEQLMEAIAILSELEVQGRTQFQAAIDAARNQYRKNFVMAFKEITGLDIKWKDLSFEEAYDMILDEQKGASSVLGRIVDKEINKETLTSEEFLKLRDAVEKKRKTYWREQKDAANSRLALEAESAPVKSAVRKVARNIGRVGKNILRFLDMNVIATAEDLSGLMDRILSSSGELFGGPLMEFVTDGVRASTREFKARRRQQQGIFFDKYKEIYGKNWRKRVRENSVVNPLDIYYSEAANKVLLEQKEKIQKSNASERTKKDLILLIDKQIIRNQLKLSQNQMFYLYNQFKDPALRYLNGVQGDPSKTLINTFDPSRTGLTDMTLYEFDGDGNLIINENGEFKTKNVKVQNESANVLKKIEENLDEKVKEWADWQVDIYYPSVYGRYNDVYKNMYRISMPQNQYYAGRLFRDAPENLKPISVLPENKSEAYNPIAPDSTKVRLGSDKAIHFVDGDNALINYMKDMEYFAAYAETIRDIYKVFSDPSMKKAISKLHGDNVNKYIEDSIVKIANKGSQLGAQKTQMINFFNTAFLLSRLGANLTLVAKQLTSIPTYGNDIGYRNWIKYAVMTIPKLRKTYKEIMDNSVILQDRYGYTVEVDGKKQYVKSTPIQKNIENYEDQQNLDMIPTALQGSMENIVQFLMLTTMVGDRGAILIGGMPNYLYYKDKALKAGKTEAEATQEAILKFEKDTLKTQQSYDLQDKDYYQTGGAFTRAFNMFLTTPKQYFRREVVAMRNLHRKLVAWDINAGRGTLWQNSRTFLTYHFMMPMLFEYASQGFPGILRDFTDEDKRELGWAAVLGNFNAIFLYGQALEGAIDYLVLDKSYGSVPQSLPVLEQTSKLADLLQRANNAKKQETRERNMEKFYVELVSTFGIPAGQIKKLFGNYSQLVQGDFKGAGDAMLLIMGFSNYMRDRADKKDSSVKLTEKEKEKYIPGYKERKRREQSTPQYKKLQERKRIENERKKKQRELYLKRRFGGRGQ